MKKIINFRPLFWIAISSILAILTTLSVLRSKWFLYVFLSTIMFALALLCFFKPTRKWILKHLIFIFSLVFVFVLFVTSFSVFENIHEADRVENSQYTITGTISNVYKNNDYDYTRVTLTNVSLTGLNGNKKLKKDMFLYVNSTETTLFLAENLNDVVSFNSNVVFYELYNKEGKIEKRTATSGASARTSIYNENQVIITKNNSPTIIQKIQLKTKSVLFDNMQEDYAALNYAMLFGDKNSVDSDIKDAYSISGIYHLLAVSGLHVGFLVALLTFVLSLFKLKQNIRSIIIAVFVFLYAMICGFMPSVSRAAIMAMILLYAASRGRQYDGINSLSLSLLIILLINPADCFDVGLYLSFTAVFSIIALTPSISSILEKFLTKNIATTIALTISAQLGTLPIVIKYFERMSLYGVFSNMLAVPIASIGFMSLFITTIIVLILPFMKFLLFVPEFFIKIITTIATAFANINFAIINIKFSAVAVVLFYAALFIWSDFLFIKKKWFSVLVLLSAAVSVTILS